MNGILKMPRMGETMEEGTLTAWLVEPGQSFKRGDALLEVETDKTVVEFPALGDGIMVKALVELGKMVNVGTPIAEIDVGDGPNWTDDRQDSEKETQSEPSSDPGANTAVIANVAPPILPAQGGPKRATPLARRIAQRNGIDIASLTGSGRRGRLERSDIEALITRQLASVAEDLKTGHGIAWLEKGNADGTSVLFVHGFAADHTAWAGQQAQMARAGCRTLAVDLPSHGASTTDAHDTDGLLPPLQSVAQDQLGWAPAHIVAHSMGAIAAMRLATFRPTASLTLITPAGLGRRINTSFLEALARPNSLVHLKSTLKRLTAGPNGLSDAAIQAIYANLGQNRISALAESLAGASGQAVDMRRDLAALAHEMPVSLILGHRDQIVDWSEALDVSPLISTHHFPDVGHMPHWEAPSEVQAILQRKITT